MPHARSYILLPCYPRDVSTGTDLTRPSPVRRNLLREQVRLELINRIVLGELASGERLSEAHLAAELEVSRTPLKEAMLAMEREGFLQVSKSRGHVVTPLSLREIEEVYPILLSYEMLIFTRYPPSAATLDSMEAINAKLTKAKSPKTGHQLDSEFHAALAADCPNQHLLDVRNSLQLVLDRYGVRYAYTTFDPEASPREHQEFLEAARKRDTAAGLRALEGSWNRSQLYLIEALKNDGHTS